MGPTIEWSTGSFIAEKIEYVCHTFTKEPDSFTADKGMFIAHIDKRNVDKSCFEVLQLLQIKKPNLSRIMKRQFSCRREYVNVALLI